LPWFFVNNFINAVNQAEDILGRPGTTLEIFTIFKQGNHYLSVNNAYEAAGVLMSIYREDMILSDSVCY
jgi:hypothetical protein